MQLDIYALDAANIDGGGWYGTLDSDRFKEKFSNSFDRIYEKANSIGCRLGMWLGPDGFGDTPEEGKARTDMIVGLSRDYNFMLYKFDACASGLRSEKEDAFVNMLIECRKHTPDLITLNHRIKLSEESLPHMTT